jgi:ribosomal protein L11 methylase PrmA
VSDPPAVPPRSRVIRVTTTPDVAEIVTDRMWQWGVQAVGEIVNDDGTVEVFTSVGADPDAIRRATTTLDPAWSWVVEDEPEASDAWKHFAEPVWYRPGLVVAPAWRADDAHLADAEVVTWVEPGT